MKPYTFIDGIIPLSMSDDFPNPELTRKERDSRKTVIDTIMSLISKTERCTARHERAKTIKECFEYIILNEVFKFSSLKYSAKFRITTWNKLCELEYECVPGPHNPQDWVHKAKRALRFLSAVDIESGKLVPLYF